MCLCVSAINNNHNRLKFLISDDGNYNGFGSMRRESIRKQDGASEREREREGEEEI